MNIRFWTIFALLVALRNGPLPFDHDRHVKRFGNIRFTSRRCEKVPNKLNIQLECDQMHPFRHKQSKKAKVR